MNTKPLKPTVHGIMDYAISGALLSAPYLIGMNRTAANTYAGIGAGYSIINALTDTKAGVKKMIPFDQHKKADIGMLAGITLLSLTSFIRKDKRALNFHLGLLALAGLQFILTDFKATSR